MSNSPTIPEDQAVETAVAKAAEMEFDLAGHDTQVANVDGKWQVSFVPSNPNQLGGGFMVTLSDETGEVESAQFGQ